jgi:hypothetical protein
MKYKLAVAATLFLVVLTVVSTQIIWNSESNMVMSTVEINKSFGRRNYGTGLNRAMEKDKMVSKFTLTEKAEIGKLTVYGLCTLGANIKGIIYSDSAGSPSTLLGATPEVTVTGGAQLVVLTFASRITLEAGNYWIGIHHKTVGGTFNYICQSPVTGGIAGATDDYDDGTAASFGAVTWYDYEMCIYATYYVTKTIGNMVTGHTVVNVLNSRALRWQEKLCFAADRIWLVYVENFRPLLTSSADDGVTWTTPEDLGTGLSENLGENLQIVANEDGTNRIHLLSTKLMNYRSGIANSDGTVTWTAAWTQIWVIGGNVQDGYLALDSEGYPYITQSFGGSIATSVPYVNKSTTKNGVWTTAAGYPLALAGVGYTNTFIVALSNQRMYAFYFSAPGALKGKLWSGWSWSTEETVSTSLIIQQYAAGLESYSRGVVVDENDNIHVVFLEYGGPQLFGHDPFSYDLIYVKRDWLTGWEAERTIVADIPFKNACPAVALNEGFVRIFWLNDPENYIAYRRIDSEDYLGRTVYLVDETTDTFDNTYNYGYDGVLNPFAKLIGDKFGMVWVTKTSTPGTYAIKFGLQNFSYEYDTVDTREFEALKRSFRKKNNDASLDVTRLALSLGDRDATSGQYALEYTIGTVEMILIDKAYQRQALELGYLVQLDAIGYTSDVVRVYDRIQDGVGRTWLVKAVTPVFLGNVFKFYVCNLKEISLYVE